MRVALNMTDPLRTMLFSCNDKIHNPSALNCVHQNLYFKRQKLGLGAFLSPSVTHQVILTEHVVSFHTYSPELDASTHFELYSPAHDVDTLVSTDDGLAVRFNVQVRCCTTGDLKSETKHENGRHYKQHIQRL